MPENNDPWAVVSVGGQPVATATPTPTQSTQPSQPQSPAPKTDQPPDDPWAVVSIGNKPVATPAAKPPVDGNGQPTAPHVPAGQTSDDFHPEELLSPEQQVALGVVKGVGQTANTVSKVLNKIPFVGEYLAPKAGIKAADQIESTHTVGEKVGVGLEGIGEFFLGDEALKGLSLAERAGLLAKVSKLAESNPVIAKIVSHGLNAVRGGVTTGVQQMAHGATPSQALETGATAAGLGTVAGAGIEGAGALKNTVKGLLDTKAIQPELQTGIRDILSNTADEAGVAKSAAPSIRRVSEETADAVYAKSKAQYEALDEATGGRFQRFKDRLDNIRQKLNGLTGTEADTAEEAKLLQAQHETEGAMQDAFEDAKAKGVDPKLVDEANANFKKSQALYDLDSQIKKVVTGGRPGVTPTEQLDKAQELIDPKKFLTRVNGLYDSGRLQEALGVKGADDLFNHAIENSIKNSQILRNQRIAKYAVGAAGLGALGHGTVSHVVHAVAPAVVP